MEVTKLDTQGRPCKICQVWLPCELIQKISERAQVEGVSDTEIVTRALRSYFDIENASG